MAARADEEYRGFWGCYLLLCNKLPQTKELKTTFICHSHNIQGSGALARSLLPRVSQGCKQDVVQVGGFI